MSDMDSLERFEPEEDMGHLRDELGIITKEIIELIARRRAVARKIGAVKVVLKMPAFVPQQHTKVQQDIRIEAIEQGVPPDLASAVFAPLLVDSVLIQTEILGHGTPVPTQADLSIVQ